MTHEMNAYYQNNAEQDAHDLTMALLFDIKHYVSDVKTYARAALYLTEQDMVQVIHKTLAGDPEVTGRLEYTAKGLEATEGAFPMTRREAAMYEELVVPLSGKLGELAVVQQEGSNTIFRL